LVGKSLRYEETTGRILEVFYCVPYSCIKYGAGGLKKIRNTALLLVETAPGRRSE